MSREKVLIIGGGAAGMMAAIFAARNGQEVHVYEKNEKLGKKLFITGKGRCNLTNACETEELFSAVQRNAKFLYSSFYGFSNFQTMEFFEELGIKLKIERGNRVFPESDHSSDVIHALEREMKRCGVHVYLYTKVKRVLSEDGRFRKIELESGEKITGDRCIVATGGLSYRTTGSDGDGYRFAKDLGHSVEECCPALVPMGTKEDYVKELQGLSLRNVTFSVWEGTKKRYEDFGELLFTHYGVSGPLVLSASSQIGRLLRKKELSAEIDLKPALSENQLDQRVLREFEENHKKSFKNAIDGLFPAKLRPVMVELSGIDPEKKVYEVSKEERKHFIQLIKHFPLTLTGLRGYEEAIITSGGVNIREIDPSTMESKKISGVYFIGEVLDLDALTGGFNLQIAWSTAFLAGIAQ